MENKIEQVIRENISNQKVHFVFPTQMAAELWADRAVFVTECPVVAMERFVAWDDFKGNSVRSRHQEKRSVPSVMRKIFARQLIRENSRAPFLKNLIVPQYAENAQGFASWISSILPSLELWKKYFEESKSAADDADCDLLEIYRRYSAFLEANSLFDPAWERPPFKSDGNRYIIFYPEILSDYSEYESILKSAGSDIQIINFEGFCSELPEVNFYSTSRTEIKSIALYLRKIHEEIPWDEIAVSVPNLESYGTYIGREFDLYEIPYVVRNARPLSSSGAGNVFSLIQKCRENKFDFSSLKHLLLNSEIPWSDRTSITQLLDFGRENNCICTFSYNGSEIDVWEESFKTQSQEQRAFEFYSLLKNQILKITSSKTFSELRTNYFIFKNTFFDMGMCSEKNDRIISRCISELSSLIDLEKEFSFELEDAFSFFCEYLDDVNYLEQTKERGVQVLSYQTAASAPFSCHIVCDASQAGISVIYKPLNFLLDDKRRFLLGKKYDANVSKYFIELYRMNSTAGKCVFTCALKTFTGFSQCSSDLAVNDLTEKDESELFGNDSYYQEKLWFRQELPFPEKIFKQEKCGFENWSRRNEVFAGQENSFATSERLRKIISDRTRERQFKNAGSESRLFVSATQLKNFFKCPRYYFIKTLGKLNDEVIETSVMDCFMMGNLNHHILSFYFTTLCRKNLVLKAEENGLPEAYEEIFNDSFEEALNSFGSVSFLERQLIKSTKTSLYKNTRESIIKFSRIFDGCFVHSVELGMDYEVPGKNYILCGKLDCLVYDQSDDEYILIDFKTSGGSVPKNLYFNPLEDENSPEKNSAEGRVEISVEDAEPEQFPDFQIPVYVELLEKKHDIKAGSACFFDLSSNKTKYVFGEKLKKITSTTKTAVTREAFMETVEFTRKCTDYFAEKVLQMDFSIDSEKQTFEKCLKCNFCAVCRRTFNVDRRS